MRYILPLALMWATSASAIPLTMTHSGRLLDAEGAPINTPTTLDVTLYDGSGSVWTDEFENVPVEDGYFSLVLGSGVPLTAALFDAPSVEIGVSLGTTDLLRQPLHSVSFAMHAASVSGVVRVSEDGVCGAAGSEGTLRYQGGSLQLCDGSDWAAIDVADPNNGATPETAGQSCKDLKLRHPGLGSGVYYVDPDGAGSGAPFQVTCDMVRNGGGWTLCLASRYFSGAKPTGWANNTWVSTSWNTGTTALIADANSTTLGNICDEVSVGVTEMFGASNYTQASGFTDMHTGPIPYSNALFNPSGNGNFVGADNSSIGIDSAQRGIYGSACTTVYTTNTYHNMQSLCFENNDLYQAQHTGWVQNTQTACTDSSNQPCTCNQDTYCGGSSQENLKTVMSIYVR